ITLLEPCRLRIQSDRQRPITRRSLSAPPGLGGRSDRHCRSCLQLWPHAVRKIPSDSARIVHALSALLCRYFRPHSTPSVENAVASQTPPRASLPPPLWNRLPIVGFPLGGLGQGWIPCACSNDPHEEPF